MMGPVMRAVLPSCVALLFGLIACGEATKFASPPSLNGARSLVVVDHARSQLHSVQVDEPGWMLELPYEANSELIALAYDCELQTLGLRPGEVDLDPAGAPLPASRAVYTTSSPGSGWYESSLSNTERDQIRRQTDRDLECAQFEATTMFLGTLETSGWLALAVRDDSAIIGLGDRYVEAFPDGSFEERAGSPGVPSKRSLDADRFGDELVFLTQTPWCLERFSLEGVATSSVCADPDPDSDSARWAWISGDRTGVSSEVFMFHEYAKLFVGDRNQLSAVWEERRNIGRRAGLRFIGPQEVIAAGLNQVQAVRYKAGEITIEPTGVVDLLDKIQSVELTKEHGPLIGTSLGAILHRTDDKWRPFDTVQVARARHIIEVANRIIVLGDTGTTAEVSDSGQECPNDMLYPGEPARVRPTKDGFVVLSTEARLRAFVTFVKVTDPVRDCPGSPSN